MGNTTIRFKIISRNRKVYKPIKPKKPMKQTKKEKEFEELVGKRLVLPVVKDKSTNQKRVTIPKKSSIGEKGYVEVKDYE